MSEETYGRSETEMATEAFVDRMMDLYPNLDREEFHEAISECVQNTLPAEEDEERSEREEG